LIFIAWRNIWRNPVRSALTISALVGGLVMVILYAALLEGLSRQMVRNATEVSSGHLQIHRQAFIDDQDLYATLPWSYLERMENAFPSIHMAPRLYAAGLASTVETSTGVLIRAVDAQRESAVTAMLSHVRRGEALLDLADTTASGLNRYNLLVGAQLAKNMQLEPGSELVLVTQAADGSIGNALYRVAGVLKPLEPAFDRMGVLMSVAAYRELLYLESGFHEVAVKLDDIGLLAQTQSALDAELSRLQAQQPLDSLGGVAVVRNWRQLNPAVSDMLQLSGSMLLLMGLIVVGLASLGMLNTMLMAVHERTHEFGILLAIGMKRRRLLLMVLLESLFLALVSALIGSIVGALLAHYLEIHGIDFSASMPDGYDWGGIMFEPVMYGYLEPGHIVQACALTLIVSLIASLIPSWRTVRLKPAEVLR
jgi:ABC-type lipoprotein release transport system permease subunit